MRKYLLCIIITATFQVLSPVPPVHAATRPETSMTLLPAINTVTIDRGKSYSASVTVTNNSSTSITITESAEDFGTTGEQGNIVFYQQDKLPDNPSTWFTISRKPFLLKPHLPVKVPVTISVPSDAYSGGYYVSLFFQGSPQANRLGNISTRIGSLFFITIPGHLITSAKIVSATFTDASTHRFPYFPSSLIQGNAINFTMVIQNEGNVHISPDIKMTIVNASGETVGTIKMPHHIMLPGSARQFSVSWVNTSSFYLIGTYRAEIVVAYPFHRPLKTSVEFNAFPVIYVTILLTVLIAAIILVCIIKIIKKNREVYKI